MEHFYQTISSVGFSFKNIYHHVVQEAPDNSHFVEIGCAYGQSSAFLIVESIKSEKNIKIDLIDPFFHNEIQLSPNTGDEVCEKFLENLKPVEGKYNFKRKTSLEASKEYLDESLSFVFIDGSHEYEDVLEDLKAWIPKIKVGGVIAGHDYGWCDDVRRAVHETIGKNLVIVSNDGAHIPTNGENYVVYDKWGEGCFICQKLTSDGVFRRFEFDDIRIS